jgi:hypothetical protein
MKTSLFSINNIDGTKNGFDTQLYMHLLFVNLDSNKVLDFFVVHFKSKDKELKKL